MNKLISETVQRTRFVARELGLSLEGGEIIGLTGELGAGKTCFIQGLAEGLGIPNEEYVRSPTFTIINEYKGRIPLYHFDLYRLETASSVAELGYEEYFYGKGVCAVEWFEKMEEIAPKEFLGIKIKVTGHDSRELYFYPHGVYYTRKIEGLIHKIGSMSGRQTR